MVDHVWPTTEYTWSVPVDDKCRLDDEAIADISGFTHLTIKNTPMGGDIIERKPRPLLAARLENWWDIALTDSRVLEREERPPEKLYRTVV